MKLPLSEYRTIETRLTEAWRNVNKATDTPDSDKSLKSMEHAVQLILSAGRDLRRDELAACSDPDVLSSLAQRYRGKVLGDEDTPGSLARLVARAAGLATGARQKDGDVPDAIVVSDAIPALWRIIRGLRGDLRKRRPFADYIRLLGNWFVFILAAWLLYHAVLLAMPWGSLVVYYRGTALNTPVGVGVEPVLFRDYSGNRPSFFAGRRNWSARWYAFVRTPRAGTYAFYVQRNGGVRLWLDDKLILDSWTDMEWFSSGREVHVDLSKGAHRFRLEYYNSTGNAAVRVRWTGCGIPSDSTLGIPYLFKF